MRTYQTEFPDFGKLDVQLPAGFVDLSWHHDAAPSFAKVLQNGAYAWVAIDYGDAAKRETPPQERFNALLCSNEREQDIRAKFATDDWTAMTKWISEQK